MNTPTDAMPANTANGDRGPKPGQGSKPDRISNFPEDKLRVMRWSDPVIDELGHDPRSIYVERYWLPILGPSATLLLRRIAMGIEESPEGFTLDCSDCAQSLGIGMRGGKNGPFWRSIDRTCRFGVARRNGDIFVVRTKLPPLNAHQVSKLPGHLRTGHNMWTSKQIGPSQAADYNTRVYSPGGGAAA